MDFGPVKYRLESAASHKTFNVFAEPGSFSRD
jgi:hypothetical protein